MQIWIGYGASGLAALFLLVDAAMKALYAHPSVESTVNLGYPPHVIRSIGIIELVSVVLYAVPATAPLGAVLLTGYLGGAVASQVRVEAPLLTHVLFPAYVALFVWAGLVLRDQRLRGLFPL